ncbi:phage tail tape measure protein [Lawsonella clevelandensis]|uniref:phage tail tape measure protein n=1 Tax=Lawsonella clevelandensis TaxID=1528099 RepID=UPI0032D8DAE4
MQNGIYVPVLASARGLVTQVKREAEKAGQAGGKAMAAKFGAAGRAAGEAAAAGISASSRKIERAAKAAADARDRQAKAAGNVRLAEAKLKKVLDDSSSSTVQRVRAEERLAAAKRRAADTSEDLKRREADLASVRAGGERTANAVIAADARVANARSAAANAAGQVRIAETQLAEAKRASMRASNQVTRVEGLLKAARADGKTGIVAKLERDLTSARKQSAKATERSVKAANDLAIARARVKTADINAEVAEGAHGAALAASGAAAGKAAQKNAVFGKSLKGVAASAALTARSMAGGLGFAGVGMALKGVVQAGMEFETNLNTMQAVSGATASQMRNVKQAARELGTDSSFVSTSAADAALAMAELAKAGMNADQSMAAARGTLQLAEAAQISGAEAATIQANALNAFGLEASQAGYVSDVLANAANKSSAEMKDIADGMQQTAAVARSYGVSIDDTAAALAVLANNGIKGSDAGTLMKRTLQQLANPSKQVQGALQELGVEAFDAQGNFKGMAYVMGALQDASKSMSREAYVTATNVAFGSDAARFAGIAAKEGAEGFIKMQKGINQAGAAAKLAKSRAKGLPGAWSQVKNAVEDFGLVVYDAVDKPLTYAAKAATWVVEKVTVGLASLRNPVDTFNKSSARMKAALIGLSAVAIPIFTKLTLKATWWGLKTFWAGMKAAAGWVAAKGAAIKSAAVQIIQFGRVLKMAAWATLQIIKRMTVWAVQSLIQGARVAAGWVLAMGPVGWVIATLTAVGAAIAILWNKSDAFRNFFINMWNHIKTAAGGAADWITKKWDMLGDWWDGFTARISEGWRAAGDFFKKIYNASFGKVFDKMGSSIDGLKGLFNNLGSAARAAFSGLADLIKAPLHALGRFMTTLPGKIMGVSIPFISGLHNWGAQLQGLRAGGAVRQRDGKLHGPGTGTSDSIMGVDESGMPLVMVSNGESVVNAEATAANWPWIKAMNSGLQLPRLAEGGMVAQRTGKELRDFVDGSEGKPLQGDPYVYGGKEWGDCSGAMGAVAAYAVGLPPFAQRYFSTSTMGAWLSGHGFTLGKGGDGTLRFGWYGHGANGHTAGTLPDGTNIEMGGADPSMGKVGGNAAGWNLPGANQFAFIQPKPSALASTRQPGVDKFASSAANAGSVGGDMPEASASPSPSGADSGSATWGDMIGNVAATATSSFLSGQINSALQVWGLPTEVPAWVSGTRKIFEDATGIDLSPAGLMKYGLNPSKENIADRAAAAEENGGKSSNGGKGKGKKPTEKQQYLAGLVQAGGISYDPKAGAGQWRPMVEKAHLYLGLSGETVPDTLSYIGKVSGGNPKFQQERGGWKVAPRAKKNGKGMTKGTAWADNKSVFMGLGGLTRSAFNSQNDTKLPDDPFDPASSVVAMLRFAGAKTATTLADWLNASRDQQVQYMSKGGVVKGKPGKDKNPAMLTAGELVIPKEQAADIAKALGNSSSSNLARSAATSLTEVPLQAYDNVVPEAMATAASSATSAGFDLASTGVKTAGNALGTAASFIPYIGGVASGAINTGTTALSAGIDIAKEPASQLAGMAAEQVGLAGGRMLRAGRDTAVGFIPDMGIPGLNTPQLDTAGMDKSFGGSGVYGSGVGQPIASYNGNGGGRVVTINLYPQSMSEAKQMFSTFMAQEKTSVGVFA